MGKRFEIKERLIRTVGDRILFNIMTMMEEDRENNKPNKPIKEKVGVITTKEDKSDDKANIDTMSYKDMRTYAKDNDIKLKVGLKTEEIRKIIKEMI